MFQKSGHYCKMMQNNKSKQWITQRYYGHFNLSRNDFSTFGDKQTGNTLKSLLGLIYVGI